MEVKNHDDLSDSERKKYQEKTEQLKSELVSINSERKCLIEQLEVSNTNLKYRQSRDYMMHYRKITKKQGIHLFEISKNNLRMYDFI